MEIAIGQFVKENGTFPIRFSKEGLATTESLAAFARVMDQSSERMIDTADPAFYLDAPNILILSGSAGFGQSVTIKLRAKK